MAHPLNMNALLSSSSGPRSERTALAASDRLGQQDVSRDVSMNGERDGAPFSAHLAQALQGNASKQPSGTISAQDSESQPLATVPGGGRRTAHQANQKTAAETTSEEPSPGTAQGLASETPTEPLEVDVQNNPQNASGPDMPEVADKADFASKPDATVPAVDPALVLLQYSPMPLASLPASSVPVLPAAGSDANVADALPGVSMLEPQAGELQVGEPKAGRPLNRASDGLSQTLSASRWSGMQPERLLHAVNGLPGNLPNQVQAEQPLRGEKPAVPGDENVSLLQPKGISSALETVIPDRMLEHPLQNMPTAPTLADKLASPVGANAQGLPGEMQNVTDTLLGNGPSSTQNLAAPLSTGTLPGTIQEVGAELSASAEKTVPLASLTDTAASFPMLSQGEKLNAPPVKGAGPGVTALAASSVSNSETEQKPMASGSVLQSIQAHLQAMNGQMESIPAALDDGSTNDSEEEGVSKLEFSSNSTTDSAAGAAWLSGVASGSSLDAASGVMPQGEAKAPHFSSSAAQPVEQVADGAIYSVKNGHRELIIRLNPDNLGEVRINLVSNTSNNTLSGRLIASTAESHELLTTQLDSLKQSLELQGVQVDRLSVVLAGTGGQDLHREAGHQQQQQSASQQEGAFQSSSQGGATSSQSHSFHQQEQAFAQLAGQFQQKSGSFAQSPWRAAGGQASALGEGASESIGSAMESQRPVSHDQGRISILV